MTSVGDAMVVLAQQRWLDVDEVGHVLAAGRSTNRQELESHRIQVLLLHRRDLESRARSMRARVEMLNAGIDFLEQRLPLMQAALDMQR